MRSLDLDGLRCFGVWSWVGVLTIRQRKAFWEAQRVCWTGMSVSEHAAQTDCERKL